MVQESESTFTFESNLSKSFCSSLPCFLCSSAALESLHTEAMASSLVMCQSSHLTLLPWATSWPPAGGEAGEFPRNRWCRPTPAEQGHLLTGMRGLHWWRPPPSQILMFGLLTTWAAVARHARSAFTLSHGPSCLWCFWERDPPLLLLLLCIMNCRPIFYIGSYPLAHLPSHFFCSSGLPPWSLIFCTFSIICQSKGSL